MVQTIVQDQQWILPLRNGELPSKPPFFHWVAALTALVFGLSDFIVRLPAVIGAEIMVIATFLLGRAMGGRSRAWLAVGALLGMHEFWSSGMQARVDMVFSACVTVSVAGCFFWYRNGNEIARAACYIATACAVLAKGPAGMVLPGLIIAGFFVAEGRLRLLWTFWSWPLAGLMLFIDVGWYSLAYQIGGHEFFALQILQENVERVFDPGNQHPRHIFLSVAGWLATQTLPWSLALFWCLMRRLGGERESAGGHFLHAWWIAIFAVFTVAAGKRAVYLLPLYPAIALLAARAMDDFIRGGARCSLFDFIRKTPAPSNISRRPRHIAKRVGLAIALFDMVLVLVSHESWRQSRRRQARLAFVEKIGALVPPHGPLFATPQVGDADLWIIAYRLGREIPRKSMADAEHSDYFLSPVESPGNCCGKTRVLASSAIDKLVLVGVVTEVSTSQN